MESTLRAKVVVIHHDSISDRGKSDANFYLLKKKKRKRKEKSEPESNRGERLCLAMACFDHVKNSRGH